MTGPGLNTRSLPAKLGPVDNTCDTFQGSDIAKRVRCSQWVFVISQLQGRGIHACGGSPPLRHQNARQSNAQRRQRAGRVIGGGRFVHGLERLGVDTQLTLRQLTLLIVLPADPNTPRPSRMLPRVLESSTSSRREGTWQSLGDMGTALSRQRLRGLVGPVACGSAGPIRGLPPIRRFRPGRSMPGPPKGPLRRHDIYDGIRWE